MQNPPNLIKRIILLSALAATTAHALPPTDDDVDRRIERLIEFLEAQQIAGPGGAPGSFRGERAEGVHAGGVSALATLALLHAGVPWHDPVIQRAVEHLQDHPLPGTYSRSLRAAVYAHLSTHAGSRAVRSNVRRFLQADTNWLVKALKIDGMYGYDARGTGGDHSCTQFGVLGTWIAEHAGGEVPATYWRRVAEHWASKQNADGSWGYSGADPGRVTMTTAGVNTMYILLAQLHARSEPPYRRLRGVGSRRELDIKGTYASIERALGWIAQREVFDGGGYQLFGLERLGVASGLKYVGGVDWYREGVARLESRGNDTVQAAFELLFLTYGRAPVLSNKLQYGEGPSWNRYYRDLHFLTDWLSTQQERIYKWQIVTADSPLHDLLDAPILLISGNKPLKFTAEQTARLAEYIDAGGTIIGHADLNEKRFARSFREMFEGVFGSRDWKFYPVDGAHPIFRAIYGRDRTGWGDELRIETVSDGLRTPIMLFTRDISGAWHQNRRRDQRDLFELMGNVRAYAAPSYDELPRRLRPRAMPSSTAPAIGFLTIGDSSFSALAKSTAWRWHSFGKRFRATHGVHLLALPPDVDAHPDIIHVSGITRFQSPDLTWTRLRDGIDHGAWLLLEGDDDRFIDSVEALLERVVEHFDAKIIEIGVDHPLLTGAVPGGGPIGKLSANRAGKTKLSTSVPPIRMAMHDDQVLAVAMPFHLLAPASGHFLYDHAAYHAEPSRRLLENLLAWRYHDIAGRAVDDPARRIISKRNPGPLAPLLVRVVDAERYDAAVAIIDAIESLSPDSAELADARGRIHRRLAEQIRVAREERRGQDANRLGRFLLELVPNLTEGVTIFEESIDRAERMDELPAALDGIAIEFNEQHTNARVLLGEWFKWDDRRPLAIGHLADLRIRENALVEQVQSLQRQRAGQRRGGGKRRSSRDPRKRDPAIEKIAVQRREIEQQIAVVRIELAQLEEKMRQLDEVLVPLADRIAEHGVRRDGDQWVRD